MRNNSYIFCSDIHFYFYFKRIYVIFEPSPEHIIDLKVVSELHPLV